MTIRYIIAVGITAINQVWVCCVVHDGLSEVLVVGRVYVAAIRKVGISGGFMECTNPAEKWKMRLAVLR